MSVHELNKRSQDIFRHVVEAYVETGEPVGSRTLSKQLGMALSPATIRNVMSDLEDAGLLYAPHTSAGRLPTPLGLKLFVHGLLEVSAITQEDRDRINAACDPAQAKTFAQILEDVSQTLSGLSQCAGLVTAPKCERSLRHVEFVALSSGKALVILVNDNGIVENRIISTPPGLPVSTLVEASNYINAKLGGRSLTEAREAIQNEMSAKEDALDTLARDLVQKGLAAPTDGLTNDLPLIIKGQSQLLRDVKALADLERLRQLFEDLDTRRSLATLLDEAAAADGVQIFIGAENELFQHAGCSLIVSPYTDDKKRVIGAIGVIGPSRVNYAKIIPIVDYTAQLLGKLMDG